MTHIKRAHNVAHGEVTEVQQGCNKGANRGKRWMKTRGKWKEMGGGAKGRRRKKARCWELLENQMLGNHMVGKEHGGKPHGPVPFWSPLGIWTTWWETTWCESKWWETTW